MALSFIFFLIFIFFPKKVSKSICIVLIGHDGIIISVYSKI